MQSTKSFKPKLTLNRVTNILKCTAMKGYDDNKYHLFEDKKQKSLMEGFKHDLKDDIKYLFHTEESMTLNLINKQNKETSIMRLLNYIEVFKDIAFRMTHIKYEDLDKRMDEINNIANCKPYALTYRIDKNDKDKYLCIFIENFYTKRQIDNTEVKFKMPIPIDYILKEKKDPNLFVVLHNSIGKYYRTYRKIDPWSPQARPLQNGEFRINLASRLEYKYYIFGREEG